MRLCSFAGLITSEISSGIPVVLPSRYETGEKMSFPSLSSNPKSCDQLSQLMDVMLSSLKKSQAFFNPVEISLLM